MRLLPLLSVVLVACWATAAEKAAPAPRQPAKIAASFFSRAQKMAMEVMPQEKFNEAAGFFGPVSKKYMPVFRQFQAEYQVAKEKLPVIAKYVPEAEAAYAEAKQMKVPARYEAKKTEYLQMIENFMKVLRMTAMFAPMSPAEK